MSEPFVGQIIAVGFDFAPVGWALCNGATMPISGNETLYQLIGTTYGGNGTSTFNLPDLRGRGVIGVGQGTGLSNYILGQPSGVEQVTLTTGQIGVHTHAVMGAAGTPTAAKPVSGVALGTPATEAIYATSGATTALAPATVGPAIGSAQPHENRQPYLTVNYIIALFGLFPSQS
jgi:microcystin-dependent protein